MGNRHHLGMGNRKQWFMSAIRIALEDTFKDNVSDESKAADFDIKALLKGILVEMEHTDNPLMAMEIATDHLAESPEYYDNLAVMEKAMKDGKSIEIKDGGKEFETEGAPEVSTPDEVSTPTAVSSVLMQIANHIDKSKNPSRSLVIYSLKNAMISIRRHPNFKTAYGECGNCGGKGKHYNWCFNV